jgi:hypothetical protein
VNLYKQYSDELQARGEVQDSGHSRKTKIWSWVSRGPDSRVTVLTRPSVKLLFCFARLQMMNSIKQRLAAKVNSRLVN